MVPGVKRIRPLLVMAFALALVFAPVAWAAANAATPSASADRSPGAPIGRAMSTVTGIAISPLLGTSALGAFQWVEAKGADARARLPWYAQPNFWIPALLVVALCAAKDALGTAIPPPLKKPLDVLEVAENKLSGLVAAGAVVPFAMNTFSKLLLQSANTGGGPTHLAMIQFLGVNWAPALDILTVPFGIAVFAIVWMASHAINVLILLSPWGAIDAALKATRTALLGLLTLAATINPWWGAVLSLVIIVVAYFVAGWSFRLTVFGAVMSWDFLTRRRGRFVPAANGNKLFSSGGLAGAPVRTYGRLVRRDDGALEFVFRPWLVMQPRTIPVSVPATGISVGSGLFLSIITADVTGTLFLLPPRYRGHESALVDRYGFGGGVRPAGLRKAWSSFKELVGGRGEAVAPAPVVGA